MLRIINKPKIMSGGGAISSMIASIKNNRRERISKLERLKSTSNHREHFVDHKKASPELLRSIRTKLQEENKKRLKKSIFLTSILMFIICLLLYIVNTNWFSITNYLK